MSEQVAAARLILIIVAASFPLSAALLLFLKWRGETVPWAWPAAWLVTGVVGLIASSMLREAGFGWQWWACLLALAPMLAVSTVVDIRQGIWFVVALDLAGLGAVAYALWRLA